MYCKITTLENKEKRLEKKNYPFPLFFSKPRSVRPRRRDTSFLPENGSRLASPRLVLAKVGTHQHHVTATIRGDKSLHVYRSGDKFLQHVVRHVAATNRLVCTVQSFWKSLSQHQNAVAAISRTNSV